MICWQMRHYVCHNLRLIQVSVPLNASDLSDGSAVHSALQNFNVDELF